MAVELGVGYVNILPEVRGFLPALNRALGDIGVRVGAEIGREFGEQFTRDASGRLRDSRGRFVSESRLLGGAAGEAFSDGFETETEGLGEETGNDLSDGMAAGTDSGGVLSALKGGLLGGIGAIAVAAGAAFTMAFALEVEESDVGASLGASLGLSERTAAYYGNVAGDIFARNFGSSVTEVGTALDAVASVFREDGIAAVEGMTEQALTLADVFGIDVAEAAAVAGTLVRNGLAKDGVEGFDLLAAAAQRMPANLRGELLPIIEEYGTFFTDLGIAGPEAFALLVESSKGGTFQLDKTGDALKELTIRATDMSTASVDAYHAAGLDASDMAAKILAGGATAREGFEQIVRGLLGIEDPTKRANAAIGLFGTPLEDLSVGEIPAFLESLLAVDGGLTDFAGTTDRAAEALAQGPSAKIEAFKRQVLGGLTDFVGGTVIPGIEGLKATVLGFLASSDLTWDTVKSTAVDAWDAVYDAAVPVVDVLGDAVDVLADTDWAGLWGRIVEGAAVVAEFLEPVIAPIREAIEDTAEAIGRIDWGQVGENIRTAIGSAVEFLRGIDWGQILGVIRSIAEPTVAALGELLDSVIRLARPVFDLAVALGEALIPVFRVLWPVIKVVGIAIAGIAYVMHKVFLVQVNALADVLGFVADKILPGLTWVLQNVVTPVLTFLADYITNILIPGWTWFAGVVIDAVTWIADKVVWWWTNMLQPTFALVVAFLRDELETRFAIFRTIAVHAWETVTGAISTAWAFIEPIWNGIKTAIGEVAEDIGGAIEDVVTFFTDLPGNIVDAVSGLADTISAPFVEAFDLVKEMWNATIGGFGFTVPSWIPGVGGESFEIPTMHTGGLVPGRGEMLALLEGGEMVLPRSVVSSMASTPPVSQGGGNQYHWHTQANDWAATRSEMRFDLARLGLAS